ncbi:MAG TPA: sulfotransferase [Actinomycetota bacterium]
MRQQVLTKATTVARRAGSIVSPASRRWRRRLRSLTLDPDRYDALSAPGPDDFLICGSPRSGTSLVCAALFQPPRCVVAMEPWDGLRMTPRDLFASLRDEIELTGRLRRGRLDVDALYAEGAARWVREGEADVAVPTEGRFRLGVKWPAYWRYLDRLPDTRFIVCLRHPVEVIRSFRSKGGRLGEGFDYDIPFNRSMNDELARATDSPEVRRVLMYEHINARLLPHLSRPNVLALRYERWFAEADAVLQELSAFLSVDLSEARIRIEQPRSGRDATDEERELIRTHAPSAAALGYEL